MSYPISLLAVFSSLVVVTLGQSDYCGFTRRHTMCLHQVNIKRTETETRDVHISYFRVRLEAIAEVSLLREE